MKNRFGMIQIKDNNLRTQQHIVDIIGSIDDKIENNNKIIDKLDQFGYQIQVTSKRRTYKL